MGEWRTVHVGDLVDKGFAEIRTGPFGTQLRAADYTAVGVPVLNVRNLGYGSLRPAEVERVDRAVQKRLSTHLLEEGDLVFARKGAVDRHVLVAPEQSGWMQGSDCIRLRLRPGCPVSPAFLSKTLTAPAHRRWMEAQGSHGATMASLNQGIIRRIAVRAPLPAAQGRIATVLAAFDELIEINERRIELLEDLARSLYREWFVRFRFPGHGNDAGSPPNDWQTKPFLKTALFINGFAFKPTHHGPVGRPIIKIKELKQGVTQATPRYGGADVPPKFEVEPGHLLFSWSADLGAYLWNGEPGLLNQHLFRVEPLEDFSVEFLFHALDTAIPDFRSRAQGTTMRHIKRSALEEVMVSVPARSLVAQFTKRVRPLHGERRALSAENRTLAATRDLLLPRLVTGRLDISDVDLGDLLPAEGA